MATGRYTTDLEAGDVLGPVEFVLSPFVVREYCHGNEMHHPWFQDTDRPMVPPTMVHLQKLRLYTRACPAGTGPTARVHVEYDADCHAPAYAGEMLRATGRVAQRYVKRGRTYVQIEIDLRAVEDGRPLITYRDTVIISYKPGEAEA
ncbi:hypothetical protein [Roseomonas marmotae]|uniref:N-terminal of MaoC-like dehydratase domain-containing protein n=1 Tax=Roseomonas marmotae TaxID=2768161 RepID=A0ABS3KFC9_9PROT|nr:hypothetical protein [Roseomonas marmotae]MBO1075051.1 hypothetical protein [Roseomonas marmotae]QTI79917.1 hypothetical protein IAI58_03795 [Roseomonas marmotae]